MIVRARAAERWRRAGAAGLLGAGLLGLAGCGDFFVSNKTGNGNGNGGSTSGVNYAYVTAQTAKSLSGFAVGTGTLTAISGGPLSLGYAAQSAVVTPNGKYLYVSGPGTGNLYTIGSGGVLSAGVGVAIVNLAAIDVSPDGNWLFGLDTLSNQLDVWAISSTDGSLTTQAPVPYSLAAGGGAVVKSSLRVAPSGAYIFAALGTAGDVVFSFNTSTGVAAQTQTLSTGSTQLADQALAVDPTSTYLFIARGSAAGGLAVYTIGSQGALAPVTGSPFPIGTGASSVVVTKNGKFVYVANRSDGTVSGFATGTGGTLTPIVGSPFAAGPLVTSLGIDVTGGYLLAAAFGGNPDLQMFSIDAAAGKLAPVISASVGTVPSGSTSNGASVIATTR